MRERHFRDAALTRHVYPAILIERLLSTPRSVAAVAAAASVTTTTAVTLAVTPAAVAASTPSLTANRHPLPSPAPPPPLSFSLRCAALRGAFDALPDPVCAHPRAPGLALMPCQAPA